MKRTLVVGALALASALGPCHRASAQNVSIVATAPTLGQTSGNGGSLYEYYLGGGLLTQEVVGGALVSNANPLPVLDNSGSQTTPTVVQGVAGASTSISSTVTTAGTFQSATAANTSRKGCFIQNTSTYVEYIYLGATGSATLANSAQVQPGATFTCGSPFGVVADDNVAITAATGGSGATYVGWIQ